jgi:hypothetical protein
MTQDHAQTTSEKSDETPRLPRDVLIGIARRYAEAMTRQNPDAVAQLFAPQGRRIDPVGSVPNEGREQIRAAVAASSPGAHRTVTFAIENIHTGPRKCCLYLRLSGRCWQ